MSNLKKNNLPEMLNKTLYSSSMEDTEKIGANFAGYLDHGSIIYILGDIGVGKSVFARGSIQSLPGGKDLIVRSPTFLYLFEYPTTPTIVHLDLYRLKEKTNLLDFGLDEWIQNKYVLFIEWPQHIIEDSIIPNYTVEIKAVSRENREIEISDN